MSIDQYTLSFCVAIAYLLLAFTMYFLSRTNKKYFGIDLLSKGCAAISIGFIFLFMNQDPAFKMIKLIIPSLIYMAGMLMLYAGTLRFFEKKVNIKLIVIYGILYAAFTIYFTLTDYNLNLRRVVDSASFATILLLLPGKSTFNPISSIRKTLRFINFILYFSAIFFIFRGLYFAFLDSVDTPGLTSLIQTLTYLNTMITGLAWGFSLIVLIYQRISFDMIEANERFELIFQTIPDSIIITDIESGAIVNYNQKFSDLTGYSSEELKGVSTLDIQLWKNIENRDIVKREIQEKKTSDYYEFSFLTKAGLEFIGLYSARIILLNGKPYLLSVIADITSRIRIEKELEQKNMELERSNQEKDKFFSIIAHDLKGPLGSMLGLTEVMSEKVDTIDSHKMSDLIKALHGTSKNVYSLIENLLDWSLIKRGRLDFVPVELNAKEAVREVVSELSGMAKKKSVKIEVNIPSDLVFQADLKMFQTILRNLVNNAVKFSYHNGMVTVTAQDTTEGLVQISVTDNGIGMESTMIDQLFQIDAKVGRPGTEGESTNGLGLVLCKEFVDKHQGSIWAESESNNGSVFHFTIPFNRCL